PSAPRGGVGTGPVVSVMAGPRLSRARGSAGASARRGGGRRRGGPRSPPWSGPASFRPPPPPARRRPPTPTSRRTPPPPSPRGRLRGELRARLAGVDLLRRRRDSDRAARRAPAPLELALAAHEVAGLARRDHDQEPPELVAIAEVGESALRGPAAEAVEGAE